MLAVREQLHRQLPELQEPIVFGAALRLSAAAAVDQTQLALQQPVVQVVVPKDTRQEAQVVPPHKVIVEAEPDMGLLAEIIPAVQVPFRAAAAAVLVGQEQLQPVSVVLALLLVVLDARTPLVVRLLLMPLVGWGPAMRLLVGELEQPIVAMVAMVTAQAPKMVLLAGRELWL